MSLAGYGVPGRPDAPVERVRGQIREAISHAWTSVLTHQSLLKDQPFDEAGGDSLQLVKFVFLLEESCGVRIPMDRCRVDMRPSDFARALQDLHAPAEQPPVVPQIFFFPGRGGDSPLMADFRNACAPLTFVTLDTPDWPEVVRAELDLEVLADRAAKRIVEMCPSGPLILAGASMGGSLAFAAARKVKRLGRDVRLLCIFDADVTRPGDMDGAEGKSVRHLYWDVAALGAAFRRRHVWEPLANFIVQTLNRPHRGDLLRRATWLRHARLPDELAYYLNRYMREEVHGRTHYRWRVRAASGPPTEIPAVLFRSEQGGPDSSDDEAMGWRVLCPGIRIVRVSGTHDTMWRPPNLAILRNCFVAEVTRTAIGCCQGQV